MADWSRGVPNELLYSIFQSLCFHDYGRCHVVCANWNFVAKAYCFRHSRQSPWLMIPISKSDNQYYTCRVDDDQDGTCSVYDVAHRLEFNISLPPSVPNWTYCIGSSQGWILILDDFGELFMLNPVTGAFFLPPSTTTLPLPCITIMPLYYSMYPYKYKMATVGWTSESSYIVMVVHGYLNERISYARSTDTSWHPMETETRFFQYIAFHDNLFYGISYTNQLIGVFSLEDGQITDYDERFEIICQRPIPIFNI
ncbi:hypothetical protein Cni_G04617 [Canna indica]|uniref:F-box domain-containing protein n=1 Tax=Canna indica TaxID=4628 RepID=A0AAQ3Q2D3_9LILI|nr:hypothetical protein Cni_G04617 [Canna indica]